MKSHLSSSTVLFRQISSTDFAQVELIESQSPSPWTEAQIRAEFARKFSSLFVLTPEKQLRVFGWCAVSVLGDEAELLKIAVHSDYRRRGYADAILAHLIDLLQKVSVERLFLEVRSGNVAACNLYRKHGFEEVGKRKAYYREPQDDALIFMKKIATITG